MQLTSISSVRKFLNVASGLIYFFGVIAVWRFYESPDALLPAAALLGLFAMVVVGFSVKCTLSELRRGKDVLSIARTSRDSVLNVRLITLSKKYGMCELTLKDSSPTVVAFGDHAEVIYKEFQNAM